MKRRTRSKLALAVLLALASLPALALAQQDTTHRSEKAKEGSLEMSDTDAPDEGAGKGEDGAESTAGVEEEVAVIETSMGDIVVRFLPDVAPKAVENFERLARKGYYDGVIFHRVISGFMVQGGDPTGTGYGGKSIWGVPFEDEVSEEVVFDRKGLLAMANAGPKTNGSQFFLTLKPTPWLNGRHTIFGEVIEGMDVLDAIGKVETGPNDRPVKSVEMKTVRIEKRKLG